MPSQGLKLRRICSLIHSTDRLQTTEYIAHVKYNTRARAHTHTHTHERAEERRGWGQRDKERERGVSKISTIKRSIIASCSKHDNNITHHWRIIMFVLCPLSQHHLKTKSILLSFLRKSSMTRSCSSPLLFNSNKRFFSIAMEAKEESLVCPVVFLA